MNTMKIKKMNTMKIKTFKKFTASMAVLTLLVITGCSNDDDFAPDGGEEPENTVLNGSLESDRILDAALQYSVTGPYLVKDGATLTIPAGTVIISQTGTDKYIAVEQGGKIEINGTNDNPVVMKSAAGNPGDWGGLLLCGEGITTEGVDAIAEVGGLIYGGTDPNDSSGSIEYLVIRGAGAQINSESQYNGLSLYAVGAGTHIANIAVINGSDDGIEFFGGNVSVTNLYFENNEDDSVDWTEGWDGTITNTYILNNSANFSTALEGDGDNHNPSFINLTAINTGSPGVGIGMQFKKQSGGTFVNVLLQDYGTNVDMKDNGPIENIIVDGVPLTSPEDNVFNGTPVDISGWDWISR